MAVKATLVTKGDPNGKFADLLGEGTSRVFETREDAEYHHHQWEERNALLIELVRLEGGVSFELKLEEEE